MRTSLNEYHIVGTMLAPPKPNLWYQEQGRDDNKQAVLRVILILPIIVQVESKSSSKFLLSPMSLQANVTSHEIYSTGKRPV